MILQSLDELESELQQGKFHPVYLVVGPERYQCDQALNLLKNIVKPEARAFDYSEFQAGEASVDEIIEAAGTFPMISKRRLVLVTEVDRLAESDQDLLIGSFNALSPRTTLVLFAEDLDRRKKLYKKMREECCVAEFPKFKGVGLERWAESFVRRQGYRISPASIKKIVDLAGSDLQSLAMELEKLLIYTGKDKTVPDKAVDGLVRESRQQRVFDLTDAVGRRDRSGALKSLANLLNMGEHPLVVVAMMARHCRQVIITQECLSSGTPIRDIASAAQIPPFVLDQFVRQARSADPTAIRRMLVKLAEIDRRLKSSPADGRMLLEGLICALV